MQQLIAIALEQGHLGEDTLVHLGISGPEQIVAVCSQMARHVAFEYAAARMSWDDGDVIMNAIFYLIVRNLDSPRMDWAWGVYLAFDAGEYGDKLGDDATRPLIDALVAVPA